MALDQDFVINRKTIFKLLIPVLIDQLFITLLPIINTVVVSKLGSSSMSSVAIVDQINQLVSMAAVAIAMGAAVVVAQYTGRGDRHGVTHTICQSYSSSLVLTLMIMVLVFKMYLLYLLVSASPRRPKRSMHPQVPRPKRSMTAAPFPAEANEAATNHMEASMPQGMTAVSRPMTKGLPVRPQGLGSPGRSLRRSGTPHICRPIRTTRPPARRKTALFIPALKVSTLPTAPRTPPMIV